MGEPQNPAREVTQLEPNQAPDSGELSPRDLDPRNPDARNLDPRGPDLRDLSSRLRAVAAGAGPQPRPEPQPDEPRRVAPASPPAILPPRASTSASSAPGQQRPSHQRPTGMQRAMHGLRAALPLVQKVLPLLEGQVFTTLSNLLAPHTAPRPVDLPPLDLSPLEGSLADLKTRHLELVNQLTQQNASLKRVAERLDQVQEASTRNANEQQELRENLQVVGRKANLVAIGALCLLALSLAANVYLFLHFQRALP